MHEPVAVRNSLHVWLQSKPTVLVSPEAKGKGKRALPQPVGKPIKKVKLSDGKGLDISGAKRLCFAFKKHGKCGFGDSCRFEHLNAE